MRIMIYSFQKVLCCMLLVVGFSLAVVCSSQAQEEFKLAIIAHPDTPVDPLKPSEIEDIFLGKKGKLGEVSLVIVTLEEGKAQEQFLKQFMKKTKQQFDMYWKKLAFTGKGQIPKSFKEEKELIAFVSKNKGCIGYVAEGNPAIAESGVKVIPIKSEK